MVYYIIVPEQNKNTPEEGRQKDETFVMELLEALQVNDASDPANNIKPKKIYRLGKPDPHRTSYRAQQRCVY